MADLTTRQQFAAVTLNITTSDGKPAKVDGPVVWATSDATVLTFTNSADGLTGTIDAGAAGGPARITFTADADLGSGTQTITGVTEDINVTQDPRDLASTFTVSLGTATDKP